MRVCVTVTQPGGGLGKPADGASDLTWDPAGDHRTILGTLATTGGATAGACCGCVAAAAAAAAGRFSSTSSVPRLAPMAPSNQLWLGPDLCYLCLSIFASTTLLLNHACACDEAGFQRTVVHMHSKPNHCQSSRRKSVTLKTHLR